MHYECELVVRINRVGKGIAERFAHRYYDQVGLGIDFTARDLQRQAIAEGLPWERCKAFDRSAALSPQFVSLQELGGDVQSPAFHAGGERPDAPAGDTSGMLFSVDRIIASVSQYMTLRMGDLLSRARRPAWNPYARATICAPCSKAANCSTSTSADPGTKTHEN